MTTPARPRRGAALLVPLRDAAWMNADRGRVYGSLFAVIVLSIGVAIILREAGLFGAGARPGRSDFVVFWLASAAALRGDPAGAYDRDAMHAAQAAMFDAAEMVGRLDFFYPPTYLLACLPLALLPYIGSAAAWKALTAGLYVLAMRTLLRHPVALAVAAAFPAGLINLRFGQNGFLAAALVALAAGTLDRRPVLAGVCLGLLACKPQLALLAPLVLAAAGRWTAFLAAAATAGLAVLASLLAFGPATWLAFLATLPVTVAAMAENRVDLLAAQTVGVALRRIGAPPLLGWGAQAVALGLGVAALLAVLRRSRDGAAAIAAMAAATLAAVPYVNVYDSVILAVPLAWLLAGGMREGFLPWEKILLLLAFLLAGVTRDIADASGLPAAALLAAAVLAMVLRRVRAAGGDAAAGPGSHAASVP